MKIRALIVSLSLTFVLAGFGAQPIVFDFQGVPAGTLPGGFLSLTVGNENVLFSGNGTAVDVSPITGTHALHTINYHGQMGMEFSTRVYQIIIGIDGNLPTASNILGSASYYGSDYNIYGMPIIYSSGSTFVFNVPDNFPEVRGLLLDGNFGRGYAVDYVSIQLVPEPAAGTLIALGAAALLLRVRKH